MAETDYTAEIAQLRSTLSNIEQVSDMDRIRADIAELEQQASAPDLWDDPDSAQKVTSKLSHRQSELERMTRLEQRIDDMTDEFRRKQLERMRQGSCSDEACIIFSELLTDFERIGDHALNIAQERAGIAPESTDASQ